jgi:hypothetical protein
MAEQQHRRRFLVKSGYVEAASATRSSRSAAAPAPCRGCARGAATDATLPGGIFECAAHLCASAWIQSATAYHPAHSWASLLAT